MTAIRVASRIAMCAVIGVLATGISSAQTLGQFTINGLSGVSASVAASSVASGAAFTSLVRGSGLTAGSSTNGFNSSNFAVAKDLNKYLGFTVKANAGSVINLTTISYQELRSNATGSPTTLELRYSLDGFGSSDVLINSYTNSATTNTLKSFDLSGISALQNVPDSTTVSVRLYGFGGNNTASTYRITDTTGSNPFLIAGTAVVIPEPSTVALLGLTLLPGAALLRRRRK